MKRQDCGQLALYLGDFHANHTALSEKEELKTTKGICGRNFAELSENSALVSLLEKMLMGYYQQYMSQYAPTWKTKVTKSGRSVYRLTLLRRHMKDTGFLLLASPRASQDFKPIRKQTPQEHNGKHGQALCSSLGIIYPERIGQYINPQFAEWMMGFPAGWADISDTKNKCSAMEMQ